MGKATGGQSESRWNTWREVFGWVAISVIGAALTELVGVVSRLLETHLTKATTDAKAAIDEKLKPINDAPDVTEGDDVSPQANPEKE